MTGKGQTFLSALEDTPHGKMRHLNVIITEPDDTYYLAVPITTYREKDGFPLPWQDKSCVLPAGCHQFIKHKSYVFYAKARKMSFAEVYNGLKNGELISKEDMSPQIIKQIQKGALESPYLPDKFKSFFEYF